MDNRINKHYKDKRKWAYFNKSARDLISFFCFLRVAWGPQALLLYACYNEKRNVERRSSAAP